MELYDSIGRGYRRRRREDPRIAAPIFRALEECASVVSVGAGAGSYEPRDLDSGAWHRRYGALLQRSTLDLGYRLVVA